jgi:LmbE family N-acetylglucosaminyl deacetylase
MYGSHPDHTAAGEAAMCAVYPDARNPFAHPELLRDEGLEEHTVAQTWVMSANERADHYVDITAHFDRKPAAHAS